MLTQVVFTSFMVIVGKTDQKTTFAGSNCPARQSKFCIYVLRWLRYIHSRLPTLRVHLHIRIEVPKLPNKYHNEQPQRYTLVEFISQSQVTPRIGMAQRICPTKHLAGYTHRVVCAVRQTPLTSYLAHHSWATLAKRKDVFTQVISESMGHSNEKTTLIYLSSLDRSVIDNVNAQFLSGL